LNVDDDLKALSEIQGRVIEMRRMAAETANARKRDACLRLADAIEQQARKLDQNSGWSSGRISPP
jgi:hypothetical protein